MVTAVADNVLEGWEPKRTDIAALVDVVRGKSTTRDYIESVRESPADQEKTGQARNHSSRSE